MFQIGFVLGKRYMPASLAELGSGGTHRIALGEEFFPSADDIMDAGIQVGLIDAPDPASAFQMADKTGARQVTVPLSGLKGPVGEYVLKAREHGLRALVSAPELTAHGLARLLSHVEGLYACVDISRSHAQGHALEDFFLLRNWVGALYLSDNGGPGDETGSCQPGYGTVPWRGLGKAILEMAVQPSLYINAPPYDAPGRRGTPELAVLECQAVLEGRSLISPAGGYSGKGCDGRILML